MPGLQPGEEGAGVIAFERDGGKGGRALVFALGFGSPIDDATTRVKDGDEVRSASNGIGVGHAGRFGVEIKPANGLAGFVIFDGLDPRLRYSWIFGIGNPSGNDDVVVAKRECA